MNVCLVQEPSKKKKKKKGGYDEWRRARATTRKSILKHIAVGVVVHWQHAKWKSSCS